MPSIDIAKLRLLNQQLLRPQCSTPVDVVRWMGAMQAQDLPMCQWAIGIRMKTPNGKAVRDAFDQGVIVRTHLNRGTWQMVLAEDLPWMLKLHGERSARAWRNFALQSGEPLTDVMMEQSRVLLNDALKAGHTMTREDLMPLYRDLGIIDERVARHLLVVAEGEGLICSGPMLGRGISYSLIEDRVPEAASCALTYDQALTEMTTRYFQSHAPATLADFVWWSGLPAGDCKRGIALLGADLRMVRVDGADYYLHVANRKGTMPRNLFHYLPAFDELIIGYKDRSAIVPPCFESKAYNRTGTFYPVILRDSQVVGNWTRKDLTHSFFEPDMISEEGLDKAKQRLLRFSCGVSKRKGWTCEKKGID